ncbi:MAG: DUF4411 family protein [Muribaculaceae bacterium]
MTYLLDTNIFIAAKNELPMDVYPSFWRALAQLAANGSFKSIKKVEDEIRKGNDELVDWIDTNLPKDFFIKENAETLVALSAVSQWATMSRVYTQAAKMDFASVADSWLVAEALSRSMTIITNEISDPQCKKRVKIPDVCIAVGVKYCDLNTAFRTLAVKI